MALAEVIRELAVVVYLTVEYHRDAAVFVGDRLRTAFDIDDGETPMSERDWPAREHSFAIWTTMTKRRHHPAYRRRVRSRGREVPGYSAHESPALPNGTQTPFTN